MASDPTANARDAQAIYVRFSDDGRNIRKWDHTPFEGGTLFIASPVVPDTITEADIEWGAAAIAAMPDEQSFQDRVQPWMMECFGPEITRDTIERNHRFLEEALELVQANGCTRSEAHQLVDYTFDRPPGEAHQEAGGVMVTLAALCLASGLNMHIAGEDELARISVPDTVAKIRAKQAAKPKHSPLPAALRESQP